MQRWAKQMRSDFNLAQALHRALAVIHAGLAVAILAGGQIRFPPPTYQVLLEMTDGQVWPWAIVIGISSFLMSMHGQLFQMSGVFLGMIWMYTFGALFAVSVVRYPESGATAPVAYFGLGLINAMLLTHYVLCWQRQRSKGL